MIQRVSQIIPTCTDCRSRNFDGTCVNQYIFKHFSSLKVSVGQGYKSKECCVDHSPRQCKILNSEERDLKLWWHYSSALFKLSCVF